MEIENCYLNTKKIIIKRRFVVTHKKVVIRILKKENNVY